MHSPKSRLYRSIDLAAAAEEIRRAVSRQREGRFTPRPASQAPVERNIFDIRTYYREIAARQIVQGPPPKGSGKKHPEDLG